MVVPSGRNLSALQRREGGLGRGDDLVTGCSRDISCLAGRRSSPGEGRPGPPASPGQVTVGPCPCGYYPGVFVWQWVQQHRFLSVVVLALVIVSAASGTAWALVFRTVSSPVGLREALRIYRREQTGKMLSSLRNKLPEPGVYTYRTSGGEGLNLVGVARSFPASTSMIVAERTCATVSWVPITQHTETTTLCNAPNGALIVPKLVTDESIAGSNSTSTINCPASTYLLPPSPRSGQRWVATCRQVSPAEKIEMTGQALGQSTVLVGGHSVSVTHSRLVFTYTGADHGTNPIDFWIVPSSGLIVREREMVGVTQGSIRYTEDMEATLTGLYPAR